MVVFSTSFARGYERTTLVDLLGEQTVSIARREPLIDLLGHERQLRKLGPRVTALPA